MPSDTHPAEKPLVRIVFGWILVPLSIAMALWIGWHYFAERSSIVTNLDILGTDVSEEGLNVTAWGQLSAEKQFLLFGDTTRKTRSAQERAIWEKYPENKIYYANYLRILLGDYQKEGSGISFDYLEKEIRRGEELDPDNAFYNYILAAVLFKRGAEWESKLNKDEEWIIKDKVLVDSAIAELNKAANKPFYRRYLSEFLKRQLALFPETRRLEDRIAKVVYLAGIPLGDLGLIKGLFKAIPFYVESNELPEADASQLLDAWHGFLKKAVPDAWSLIDVLVLNAIATMAEKKVADVYEAMDKPAAAMETRRLAKQLSEPVESWKAARKSKKSNDKESHLLKWKGSILAKMMLPSLDEPITEEMLRPGRQTDRIVFEQFNLSYILCILLGSMIGAWILRMVCQRAGDGGPTPLLLLPPWRVAQGILGFGILLPIILYFSYTRWSGLSSYENSIEDFMFLFLEVNLLNMSILAASTLLAATYIRKRCQALDITIPKPANPLLIKLFWWGVGSLCLCCAATKKLFGNQEGLETALLLFSTGMGLILCGAGLVVFIKGCKSRRTHGLYYGTLARSIMPVYACAVIFIGGICLPWLQKEEGALLKKDTLFAPDPQGFTVLEGKLTRRLQTGLADALKSAGDR